MEGAALSIGPKNINRKVIRNAYILFDVLHDDTILVKDKLPLMTDVLSGDDVYINFPNEYDGRNTLLHGAVSYGFIYMVKQLLQFKADVNAKNAEGETPLQMGLSDKRIKKSNVQQAIIKILIGRKADVNNQNLAGDTLLHLAVRQEEIPVIRLLVGKADARIHNSAGVTPLDLAKEKDNQIINDIFVSGFNKPDPVSQDEIYPEQDNNAGVADTRVANGENQVEQAEDAFADLKDTYVASGAKHFLQATLYQLCLLMLFAVRAFTLGYPFRLGTEVDDAEQFDDIVLHQLSQSGESKSLFVQVKHKENAGKELNCDDFLAKGNKAQFSLLKYFKSFVKITQAKRQDASQIYFAICTNAGFKFDEQCKLIGNKITLTLQKATDNMYQGFFKEGKCFKIVTDDETVELLRDYFVKEFEAELSSFMNGKSKTKVHTNINDVERKPDGLNTKGKEVKDKNAEELNAILSSLHDGTSLKTFLDILTIVVEQQIDNELVKTEFRANSKTNLLDTDLFTDAFYKQIFDWYSYKKGLWIKNETVEKMIESITGTINTFASSGISREHAENLLTSPLKFNDDNLIKLNDLMRENRIVNLATSMESKLTLIQVAQAIQQSGSYVADDSYMFMRISSLLPCGNQDLTVDAFKSPGKHDLLVIDCLSNTETVSERELNTLGKKLFAITTNNSQKKLVIIAPKNHALSEMFRSCSGYVSYIVTHKWNDFTIETQDILLATHIDFQGQLVELNKVIDKSETELLEIVPLETLIGDEGLVIGTVLPSHIGYNESLYIDRSVINQIVLKAGIFQDKSKGKFKEELALTEADFQDLCIEHPKANIHLIEKRGDRFVWVKSQGEFKALRPYIDITNCQSCSEEEFLNSVELQRVVIISDLAGMGKSTILTHFANKIKAKCEGTLVFRVDLNNYTKLWNDNKTTIFDNSSALEFLCREIILLKTPLEKALFKRKEKVVLLFDGFDEISPDYEETVLGLIQNLTEATEAQIWITTRPFMKEKLEDTLRQLSSSLEPFSAQNQVDYLIKYWNHVKHFKDSDARRIHDFASSLVSQFSMSISGKERELTGTPLQIKMLAEYFVDDLGKSPELKKAFNLVESYNEFINKKFDVYLIKNNGMLPTEARTECIHSSFFDLCINQFQYLALRVILSKDKFASLFPDYKSAIDSEEKTNMMNKLGIVNLSNDTFSFTHRTWAEYYVAQYFMELLKDPKGMSPDLQSFIMYELLICDNYAGVRSFFDGLLAESTLCYFKTLLTTEQFNIACIQKIFVQTAIEGKNNICLNLLNAVEGKDERVPELLKSDDELEEPLLNLAANNNNSEFIKSLLQWTHNNKGHVVKLMLKASNKNEWTSLHSASKLGHNDVVKTLLQWTRDNLTEYKDVVKNMLEACDRHGWTSQHWASEEGHHDVGQTFLQWTRDIEK